MFEGGILKAGVPEELVEDEMVRRVLTKFWTEKEETGVLNSDQLKRDQYSVYI
jgi:hypothetical protein